MEIRVLEYFLAVAREQSITRAAEYLHLTQPTLSRQLRELEDEFGKQLFIRGRRRVTLTDEGLFLRKRAEEIVGLAQRTEEELRQPCGQVTGSVYIGAGETEAVHNLVRAAHGLQLEHQGVKFHLISGDTQDLTDRLDKGLFDFCLLLGPIDQSKYEYITLPYRDVWGALVREDSPHAEVESVTAQALWDEPLILSRQTLDDPVFQRWFQRPMTDLKIAATYNLAFNASVMALERMGVVLTLRGLINTKGTSLRFRPLFPELSVGMSLVWKKYQVQSKASELFLESVEKLATVDDLFL